MTGILLDISSQLFHRSEFSATALERATDAVIDTLGCMIAGADDAGVAAVTTAFQSQSAGGGSLLVTGGKTSVSIAAMVNGTAAHALDFDDNFHPARAHASAVLVPALMAVTSADSPISGREFLNAYLIGLEAQAAVGYGVNPSHYNRGWHGTSTVGAIGAAAGVVRLLGGGNEEMAQAMSLAISMASGPKGQFGTLAKPIHAGIAARNAVEAAMLAMSGAAGRLDILERPQGFLDLFGGEEARGWADWRLDETCIIESRGLVTKLHPCCASTHRAIDALLDLVHENALKPEDIVAIDTKVGVSAVKNLAYLSPANAMQARFSMQYCLAVALEKGSLSLADFTDAALDNPEREALMQRIGMHAYTAAEERGHERLAHTVTLTLRNGEVLQKERLHANGALEMPLNSQQKRIKFANCLAWGRMTFDQTHFDRLADLGRQQSVYALFNWFLSTTAFD
ncbi:MmgE/PrpD family protein [Neorhizobium alkalisoli]|uniref:2-methylcitrate dehydratase PrpD n=1 Tax=Neorhizobium alkalisoli TaxID=528178 RepID=A0A561QAT5_9HYPH|nr:MmgE/PrpD family protein [Neorhizobium alkalisoli]TWF47478.1 2-methylcitrate dehydratase PrpD [Neorhizobium alkalisoli]